MTAAVISTPVFTPVCNEQWECFVWGAQARQVGGKQRGEDNFIFFFQLQSPWMQFEINKLFVCFLFLIQVFTCFIHTY